MFAFNIKDVADLCGINYSMTNSVSTNIDCIYCGKRKKLNINFQKNCFKCPACGKYGGMLQLYADINNVTTQEAKRDIEAALGIDTEAKAEIRAKKIEQEVRELTLADTQIAPVAVRNRAYRAFLGFLTLAENHRENLHKRGFTDYDIKKLQFKSNPACNRNFILQSLVKSGCKLEGVPGFFMGPDGKWDINLSPNTPGFFVPVLDSSGLIQGLQVRMDNPIDGRKYLWFSSSGKEKGCGSGSPCHFFGDPSSEIVWLTEGSLKATAAGMLAERLGKQYSFAAVSGVTCFNSLNQLLKELKGYGVKTIIEAYDMDKLTNDNVSAALQKLYDMCAETGLEVKPARWDPAYKGIDDFLLHKASGKT